MPIEGGVGVLSNITAVLFLHHHILISKPYSPYTQWTCTWPFKPSARPCICPCLGCMSIPPWRGTCWRSSSAPCRPGVLFPRPLSVRASYRAWISSGSHQSERSSPSTASSCGTSAVRCSLHGSGSSCIVVQTISQVHSLCGVFFYTVQIF